MYRAIVISLFLFLALPVMGQYVDPYRLIPPDSVVWRKAELRTIAGRVTARLEGAISETDRLKCKYRGFARLWLAYSEECGMDTVSIRKLHDDVNYPCCPRYFDGYPRCGIESHWSIREFGTRKPTFEGFMEWMEWIERSAK